MSKEKKHMKERERERVSLQIHDVEHTRERYDMVMQ
jgi:hypothetical protein